MPGSRARQNDWQRGGSRRRDSTARLARTRWRPRRARTEHFHSFDNLAVAYADVGDGELVLLLHGFAADHVSNWVAPGVVDDLVASGRRVIAPDARGHGQSAKPHDPSAYADDAMVRDVQALLGHLDVSTVDVVGYSMGAIIAGRLALRDHRVRSLVLGGVGSKWGGEERPLATVPIVDALETDEPDTIQDPLAAAFRRFADSTGADRLALAATQRARHGETTDVTAIAVPTLILVGDADQLAGSPEALAARIPGSAFRVLAGNHLSAVRDPRFSSSIVSFVNARS